MVKIPEDIGYFETKKSHAQFYNYYRNNKPHSKGLYDKSILKYYDEGVHTFYCLLHHSLKDDTWAWIQNYSANYNALGGVHYILKGLKDWSWIVKDDTDEIFTETKKGYPEGSNRYWRYNGDGTAIRIPPRTSFNLFIENNTGETGSEEQPPKRFALVGPDKVYKTNIDGSIEQKISIREKNNLAKLGLIGAAAGSFILLSDDSDDK